MAFVSREVTQNYFLTGTYAKACGLRREPTNVQTVMTYQFNFILLFNYISLGEKVVKWCG
jgi:hypothetical protein